ncbi:MAG: hypothetical protein Q4D29_13350 [Lachnospiraceae bacterium]|nr:hypothetical protein [Lachnospiraceae bacterium]
MNYGGFLMMVLQHIMWPLKGIIYAEEQFVLWHIVLGAGLMTQVVPMLITAMAIYFVIVFVVIGRERPHGPHHHVGGVLRTLLTGLGAIAFSWFFLLLGVWAGESAEAQRAATTTYTYRRRFGRWEGVRSFTRVSLHFRLGRGLYRLMHRAIGHIPVIARDARVHRAVALIICLVICLWGVWNIPYDLTH